MRSWLSPFVSALPVIVTPLVVLLWKRLTPPGTESEFDVLGPDRLAARNRGLDSLFTLLMFVGLMSPLLIAIQFLGGKPTKPLFLIGLGCLSFGLMVVLPVSVIALITRRHGTSRLREFWRFYETKWGIGLRGIAWVYIPIGALAPVGLTLMLWGA